MHEAHRQRRPTHEPHRQWRGPPTGNGKRWVEEILGFRVEVFPERLMDLGFRVEGVGLQVELGGLFLTLTLGDTRRGLQTIGCFNSQG